MQSQCSQGRTQDFISVGERGLYFFIYYRCICVCKYYTYQLYIYMFVCNTNSREYKTNLFPGWGRLIPHITLLGMPINAAKSKTM